ncbi:MAG: hypothetical protein ABIO38_08800 [Luteimonas sp.]
MKALITTATLATAMLACIGNAQAANETNELSSNGVSHCQGALPSFEGAFRKRPLAIDNEGSAPAFLTCAFELRGVGALGHAVDIYFGNNTATAKTINCTGVQGFNGDSQAVARSIILPPNGQNSMTWVDSDFTAGIGGMLAVSCQLPPGTGVNDTYAAWLENDATAP